MNKRSLIFVIALTIALFLINQWFAPGKKGMTPPPLQESSEQTPASSSGNLPTPVSEEQEQFYVLENELQQIVFSNLGGAIAQINLPFHGKENPKSAVLPIQFDQLLKEQSPQNSQFPGVPYAINRGNGVEHSNAQQIGNYYPLLRRSLLTAQGKVMIKTPPRYYALNTGIESEMEALPFTLKRFEKDLIEFERLESQRKILKTYRFVKDNLAAPYCLDVTIKVEGDARNLWVTTGVPEVEIISDSFSPALKYLVQKGNQKLQVEQLSLKEGVSYTSVLPQWVSNSNGFFGIILDPLTEIAPGVKSNKIPGTLDPTRLTLIDPQYHKFPADKYPGYEILLPLRAKEMHFRLFAGPFEDDILKKIDSTYRNPDTGANPHYIDALSFHGWFTFISEPFAKFLFILMKFFYQITSSWGLCIILLTLALRMMLYPLNAWSINSTLKMQAIAPKVTAIQEKYKKDPKRAQMEVMTLYKEAGVNPLSGCFPLLIQLPFLIGMFDLLKSTFELRGAGFIPGWITNLTAPDILFSWDYPVIFFGNSFHLLPIILGAVMWIQQRFSASGPKNPALMTDQQKQQRAMGNIMTIVFAVMFYHFPSGLNIYWLSSMLLGIVQQWWMTRRRVKTVLIS